MTDVSRIRDLIEAEARRERLRLRTAVIAGAVVTAAAVGLLGLSGWFITGAALAGLAGGAAIQTFNYLTPSAAIRLFAILRTVSRYVERIAGHEAALAALSRLRPALFRAFADGPSETALAMSAGEASARLVEDVDAVQTLFIRRSTPFALGAGAAVSVGLAGLAHAAAAAVVLLAMGSAIAGSVRIARRRADPAGRRLQEGLGRLKATGSALVAAAPELRAYGLETWAGERISRRARDLEDARHAARDAEGLTQAWQSTCLALGAVGALAAAAVAGAAHPMAALAALAAVTGVESAGGLVQALLQNGAARTALDRLAELPAGAPATGRARPRCARIVIAGLDAELKPPMRFAIIGASGCGKTSLLERLMLLRAPRPREIRLGGTPIETVEVAAVRARFAYAAQKVSLLDGSVRLNLALARPGLTDDEMWTVLEEAALAGRVRDSGLGLDMPVGPGGELLSGGERRRLSLARAYLRPAPWLVLDEPTEGLDAATEAQVLARLDARLRRTGQGLIMVSHRAGLTLCDQVARMEPQDGAGGFRFRARDERREPA